MSLFRTPKPPAVIEVNGTQIQTAVQALPIAIVYGAPRMPGNIIYANGFNAVKQQQAGGKGLLTGGKNQTNQFLYYATLICAIGEGPMGNIAAGWYNTNIFFNLSAITEVDPDSQFGKSGEPNMIPTNAQFFPGGDLQEPWSYIQSHWPSDARSYKDVCYIGLPNMQLDSSGTPPQMNFVPRGAFAGTCPLYPATISGSYTNNDGEFETSFFAGYIDADPSLCIFDFLTNERYGVGFPINLIDQTSLFSTTGAIDPSIGDASVQTYCQAVGFGWSLVLNNSEAAGSILDRLMTNLVVAIVWTGELLKFIPYYDEGASGNPGFGSDNPFNIVPKYFRPDITPLMTLTDDFFLQGEHPEDEPVTIDRIDPVDAYNYFRVTFRDRTNQYNDNVAEDSDEVSIELYGARVDTARTGDEFSLMTYASNSATLQLRRAQAIRRKVTFQLPPLFSFFDPMDIIDLTSGILDGFAVRIISIEENDTGALTVIAEEFAAGSGNPTVFPGPVSTVTPVLQTNVPTGDVNPPVIFEPTASALATQGISSPTVVIGLSGSGGVFDPNWGGATVWVSLDGVSYQTLNDVFTNAPVAPGIATQGVLTANLAAYGGANPDNTNTLSVNLSESNGVLTSTTSAVASQGVSTLCAIVDSDGCLELVAYTTATLVAANSYNLTSLYRGLYGTQPLEHLAGAQFLFINTAVYEANLPAQFVDQTIYFKFTSFNIYNAFQQDLSDVVEYTYVPTGAGVDLAGNAILLALEAGTPVNMETATGSLTCNAGGSSACSPTTFAVDLELT